MKVLSIYLVKMEKIKCKAWKISFNIDNTVLNVSLKLIELGTSVTG